MSGIDVSLLVAMMSFAFVTSATPGPNNIMLLASGANFGFWRTVPHMLGIGVGMAGLLTVALLGLGSLFMQWPLAQTLLKVVGALYLLWLAWKIGSAPVAQAVQADKATSQRAQPFRWWQAALFQFVNPKAWMMALSGVSSFTLAGDLYWSSGLMLIIAFAVINLPSISMWAGLGVALQRLLSTPKRRRIFNIVMGLLTAATVFMMLND